MKQRIAIFGIGAVVIMAAFAFRWEENPFYYANGNKVYWQPQFDVFAFRTVGDVPFTQSLNPAIVQEVEFRSGYPDKLHLVFFTENSTHRERLQIIESIEGNVQFLKSFPVVTMFENTPAEAGMWYVADDLLLVMYKNDSVRQANEARITADYGLEAINDPSSLPPGGNYAYIYKWDVHDTTIENSIALSKEMFERDSAVLWSVEPNLIRGYEQSWINDPDVTAAPELDSEASAPTFYVVNNANNTLSVYISTKVKHYNIGVYDLFGRLVTQRHLTLEDTRADVNISHLSSGIYFATLETLQGKPFATVKFIKN